jgi:PAS domain S-box-containing protein
MGSGVHAEQGRYLAPFAAFVAIIVGAFVLAGWTFGMDALTNIVPTWPRMVLLSAATFVLSGIALWLADRSVPRAATAVATLVAVIGAVLLCRDLFGWDAYLEQLSLSPAPISTDGRASPRMAPATALAFLILGTSLLLARRPHAAKWHQGLAIAVMFIAWLGMARFLFGGEPLFAFANMAVHTAVLLLLLAAGTLTLRPDAGVAALLTSRGVGGSMVRRLLPAAVIVPLAAGVLTLHFESRGIFGFEAAVSVFALSSVIVFVMFVWVNAVRGERSDNLRRAAESALRHSEERNQLIVETALDAVITIDSQGIVTGWNSQAEKTFGWPRGEALGRELSSLIIPEELRAAHREGLSRYVATGAARVLNKRIEFNALHRNGQQFPVELAITPIGFGNDLLFNAFIRDITGRNRAEAALRESEQRFRTTANAAPVLIWMSGPDKLCTWFNQRWLDFVGRAMEQELGDGWCDNLHPADFDRALDTYHAAFDARRPYEMEYRLQRDDGAWRWLLERGTPHRGPTGEFIGYIGTCIDITEHRETVEQLRESRARFKTLAESLPQMIWTCLRDGYCDYLSRQWLDYTGRSEAQQLGSGWLEQVHPDDRVSVQMEWARVVGTGDTYDVSFRIRRFDGVYRWFKTRAVPLRDPAGRILKWFGSNTDIEDFVVAERRLKVQLERMHLLDRTTQAIGAHQDLRKVFEIVLRSLEENLAVEFACFCLYHTEPEVLTLHSVGARSRDRGASIGLTEGTRLEVDPAGLSRCVAGELLHEAATSDSPAPFSARLASGGLRSFVAAPLPGDNEVFGVLIVAKAQEEGFTPDDCEFLRQLSSHVALAAQQARLYGALQAAYQDLRQTQQTVMQQERLRALGQIASGIAHDINNALSPAALYSQSMLEREAGLSQRARDQLGVINRAIDDVSRTVQRMRAFYMPRGLELTLSPVDLNALLREVVDLTRARWHNMPQERGVVVQVATDLEQTLPSILGAENELRDAFTNLLLNAVDAMPEGGTITLRTRTAARDNLVVVEVQDTGVGMSETTRSRCLEPFFTTKGERGSGLGLPMVFGTAQRHGAEVEIDSELGRGTTMRLIFPSAPTGLSVREQVMAAPPPTGLRVLLIDDDPMLLRSLRDALELDQHQVVTAEGGQAGIDAFAHGQRAGEHIDVVITDLGMPYVDGRKVAASIRQLSAEVPIIMLTGWGHRLIASDETPEHVSRVISKPPRMADLRIALADLVRRRDPQDQPPLQDR